MKKRIKKLIEVALNEGKDVTVSKPELGVDLSVDEPVYTLIEVAQKEQMSREFIRKRFMKESGVRKWGNRWRIPESVLIRVMTDQTV